jgi:hypothetical protein
MADPRVGKSEAPEAHPRVIIPEKTSGKKERFQKISLSSLRGSALCGRLKKIGESRKGL